MKAYEQQIFERAKSRATAPPDLTSGAFRAILARLAYMITTSRRGVTFPIDDFIIRFLPGFSSEGEALLLNYEGRINSVLEVAIQERLLRVDKEASGDVTAHPLQPLNGLASFYHHRLQEYYTAVYLQEFKPVLDWGNHLDDIWWQEVLVMLFGVTSQPDEYMSRLLQSIPKGPITCSAIGSKLRDLFSKMQLLKSILKEDKAQASRLKEAEESFFYTLEALFSLDRSSFYGLKEMVDGAMLDRVLLLKQLIRIFEERGLLLPSVEPSYDDLSAMSQLQPEPDANDLCDSIRRWLENHNARLLDRLELLVECYRNCSSRLSQAETSKVNIEHLASILKTFVELGNMWEAVRSIHIASKIPGIGSYAVIETVLLNKDAWCRREALAAMAKYPIAKSAQNRNIGFLIFIQFIKGESLFSLGQFVRSIADSRALAWLAPGALLLSFISIALIADPIVYRSYIGLAVLILVCGKVSGE